MSGTSVDGLDIAYVEINDEQKLKHKLLQFQTIPFPETLKTKILSAFNKEKNRTILLFLKFRNSNFLC
ncbi:anhydro-N-acetylmuramic acid kinase [Mycoplasmopsis californica]|nr:anhydro-N-acetylmuramic acid kinase [Mycoplasmopsis californica]